MGRLLRQITSASRRKDFTSASYFEKEITAPVVLSIESTISVSNTVYAPEYVPVTFALEKIFYSDGNELFSCDPDLTNSTLIWTWTAATYIDSIAIDHTNLKIFVGSADQNEIRQLNYDGTGETLFVSQSIRNYGRMTISDADALLLFDGSTSVYSVPLAGGSTSSVVGTAKGVYYIPSQAKIIYVHTSGTVRMRYANVDGTGATAIDTVSSTTSITGYDYTLDRTIEGNHSGQIITDAFPSAGAGNIFFSDSGVDIHQFETSIVNNNFYAMISGTVAGEAGIYLFTDLSASSSAHAVGADLALTLGTNECRALALMYSETWQDRV